MTLYILLITTTYRWSAKRNSWTYFHKKCSIQKNFISYQIISVIAIAGGLTHAFFPVDFLYQVSVLKMTSKGPWYASSNCPKTWKRTMLELLRAPCIHVNSCKLFPAMEKLNCLRVFCFCTKCINRPHLSGKGQNKWIISTCFYTFPIHKNSVPGKKNRTT